MAGVDRGGGGRCGRRGMTALTAIREPRLDPLRDQVEVEEACTRTSDGIRFRSRGAKAVCAAPPGPLARSFVVLVEHLVSLRSGNA